MILLSAAVIQLFEVDQAQYNYNDWVYFIIVTISTVGYGEINPLSIEGKMCVLFLIVIALIVIPKQTSDLLNLMDLQSPYARQFYKSGADSKHVLICGETNCSNLKNYSKELFHFDHGGVNLSVVVLHHQVPQPDMIFFLNQPLNDIRFTYLQGSTFQNKDLRRADTLSAQALILMTDKFSKNAVQTDQSVILQALQLKKYIYHELAVDPKRMIIQLIKPESRSQYYSTQHNESLNDELIVIEEIKMNLLAKSCFCPGIISLCCNLIISSGVRQFSRHIWMNQYTEGMGHEIYRVPLGSQLDGQNFSTIVKQAYQDYRLVIIGIDIKVNHQVYLLLNPGNFQIDVVRYDAHAYVISTDITEAQQVSSMNVRKWALRKLPGSKFDKEYQDEKETEVNEIEKAKQQQQEKNRRIFGVKSKQIHDLANFDGKNSLTAQNLEIFDRAQITEEGRLNSSVLTDQSSDDSEAALKQEYHFDEPRNLTDVIISDSLYGNTKVKNHIVLCGLHSSIYHFILPLRAKYLKKLQPIVIVTDQPMHEIWSSINRFKDIFLVQGSPFQQINLWRANIGMADKAVIMGKDHSIHGESREQNEEMLDADTIFIYKAIQNCNPRLQIMAEIVQSNNIEFLSGRTSQKTEYEFQPLYTAGEVYISSVIDMLTAQVG